MKNKVQLSAKSKADSIVSDIKILIRKSFFEPFTNNEIKEHICAFDLAIEFCDSIIDSLKWFNYRERIYWKDVRTYVIERKLYFYQANSELITEKVK
jgi:uncharacterized protein Yka (UPF0111/DUF47 family)